MKLRLNQLHCFALGGCLYATYKRDVCVCVCVSGLHGCLLSQVPPAPQPASMWKKSQIPLPLSPGGLVLKITVQLLPTPSRLEPLSPSAGKLLAQVELLTSLH